ncbi:transposase [Bacteroides graminisolvens]|uniref:transposase n=1 Tax=Bacteroides graminisolvens TaxID=477666 RepID=UPI0023F19B05|nr:transposase [Bacteroides graminisolvens]
MANVRTGNWTTFRDGIYEIDDISRFKKADRLASYIGMIPMCHSIGEHDGTGDITLRCHSMLRCMFIEAAWVAIRQDSAITQVRNIVAG